MPATSTLHVHTEILGVEVGHWCNQCLLSTGFRVWYVNRIGTSMCLHSANGCTDCHHEDVTLTDDPRTVWES